MDRLHERDCRLVSDCSAAFQLQPAHLYKSLALIRINASLWPDLHGGLGWGIAADHGFAEGLHKDVAMQFFSVGTLPNGRSSVRCVLTVACAVVLAPKLEAETLVEALTSAHDFNPRIESARARSRAVDEGEPQAFARALPKVSASADIGLQTDARNPSLARDNATRASGYDVTVVQPLFDGGRSASSLRSAKASSQAERETVRAVAQQVMLAAVTAYADVRQDRQLSRFNAENLRLLQQTALAVHRRAAIHEATVADEAQAYAAVSNAQAQVELAKANVAASEASFEEAVTHRAGVLAIPPPVDTLLPSSQEQALALAQHESPGVVAALFREQASLHAIGEARAQLLPTVNLQGGYQRRVNDTPLVGDTNGLFAKVVVTVPLYTGGAIQSEIRQAAASHSATTYQLADITAQTKTGIAQAWVRLYAARASFASVTTQLAANQRALGGLREEYRMGQRSVLDTINAQQAVLASQTSREQVSRNVVVAGYTLLALVGRLEPARLDETSAGGRHATAASSWQVSVTRPDSRSTRER